MRYTAHVRLRKTVYHWARTATQHDPKTKSLYAALWMNHKEKVDSGAAKASAVVGRGSSPGTPSAAAGKRRPKYGQKRHPKGGKPEMTCAVAFAVARDAADTSSPQPPPNRDV
jgi:hypothetical protein